MQDPYNISLKRDSFTPLEGGYVEEASSPRLRLPKKIAAQRILPGWKQAQSLAFQPRVGKSGIQWPHCRPV